MKCNASCLELRLGDHCGRCGGLVDVKKPHDGLEQRRRDFAAIPLSLSQRAMLEEGMRRLPRYFVRADGELLVDELSTRPRFNEQAIAPERCCGMVDAHGGPGCTYCPMATRGLGTGPRSTVEAMVEIGDPADLEDLGRELALANFQLAHDVVASMSQGPRPRAADDADGIQKAMREIHLAEGRRPISCAPGQHNFQWSIGNVYTCTVCLRGKPEDGR